jgi:hypothetical protein
VKDFVPDVGFEFRAVRLRIVATICSARMFFDDTRLAPDTDRTAHVEVFASAPDRKHVVNFSINSAYWASVTKYALRPRFIIGTSCRRNKRRTLHFGSRPL